MSELGGPMEELVRALDAPGTQLSLLDIARAVESAHLTAADAAPFIRRGFQSYNRMPVVVRDNYEVLVLTWAAGQGSPPHEHSGSVCVVRVLQGVAAEAAYSIAADGFVDLEYEETVAAGKVTSLHDAGVHTIRNASPGGETLVTLHVYSPPLREGRRFVARPSKAKSAPIPLDDIPTIAIVGGGFSGSMAAAHLLREATSPLRIALIERRGSIGEGVAYATRESTHLLNVPAANMSAWVDRPADFLDWARKRFPDVRPSDFLSRQLYGDYVRDSVRSAAETSAAQLQIVFDEARRIAKIPDGRWMLHLARGSSLRADAVILSIGHNPPSDPIGSRWSGTRKRFVTDPWRPFAMNAISGDEPILVLGSGLTAVDTVLSLTEYPRSAKITLVSVNGLTPKGHVESASSPLDLEEWTALLLNAPAELTALRLLHEVRELTRRGAELHDWRGTIDGLRPHTSTLWRTLPLRERRRFLSRLRPFWEVHRHRTAPQVCARFESLLNSGQVEIIGGRVESAHAAGAHVHVRIRNRKQGEIKEMDVGWVVNCTGPLPSNRPESNPAIGSLMLRGQLALDPLALGVETNAHGNPLSTAGAEVSDIFVVGTLRKPSCWESTAVPELREQAAQVAREVLDRVTRGNYSDLSRDRAARSL